MNPFNFQHSAKNIPYPSRMQYHRALVGKIEKVATNMRWKLYHIQNPGVQSTNNFGFKTTISAPVMKDLLAFEEELFAIPKSIQFRQVNCEFQHALKQTCKNIKESKDIIIKGDKSKNLYSLPVAEYEKLIHNNITKDYMKADQIDVSQVNKEAARIAQHLGVQDRVDKFIPAEAFVTVKDHKPSFPSKPEVRLLNPAKSNVGKISKQILEAAVLNIRSTKQINQWANSKEVTAWFNNLDNKQNLTFFKFDVVSFYPSISETLFNDAIQWAESIYPFSHEELTILKHSRKSFLFKKQEPWVKKDNSNFDVTMGSFDGAEVCDLVGLYILHKLEALVFKKNIGLYRDDGLAAIPGSGPQVDRLRKQFTSLFKKLGLNITVECNLKQTDFLDVFLNLSTSEFKPYRKPNQLPVYINLKSDHPSNIKRQLPKMISERISTLSCSRQVYDSEIGTYQAALKSAGYNENLEFISRRQQNSQQSKKKRRRKILWFNPPFSGIVKTNVAQKFLGLIDKHFKDKPLGKYFNRNSVKVSYSCMPNIASIIASHNNKLISEPHTEPGQKQKQECNCRGGVAACPLDGKCLQQSIIYKATVKSGKQIATYLGQAGNTFKERYSNHMVTFRHERHEHKTSLSKYIWELKRANKQYDVAWTVVARAPTYGPASGKCGLCNMEKTMILMANDPHLLNKRSELMSKCRHRRKYLLSGIT
mgnify:CR=1 FL=1